MLDEKLKQFSDEHLENYIETYVKKAPEEGYYCPYCGSGKHENGTGALNYNPPGQNGEHAYFYCYKCHKSGDLFNLVQQVEQIDKPDDAITRAYEIYKEKRPEIKKQPDQSKDSTNQSDSLLAKEDKAARAKAFDEAERDADLADLSSVDLKRKTSKRAEDQSRDNEEQAFIDECAQAIFTDEGKPGREYLTSRGFSEETIRKFDLGYSEINQRVVIPYPRELYDVQRSIDPTSKDKRYRKPKGITEPLFSTKEIQDGQIVFICEGQLDALAIDQGLRACKEIDEKSFNVIALGSTYNKKINPSLRGNKDCCLRKNSYYILALDNDAPGKEGAEKIYKELAAHGYKTRLAEWSDAYSQSKDASDMLRTNPIYFEKDLRKIAAETILKDIDANKASIHLNDLVERIKSGKVTKGISTGFKTFDEALGGGLYGGCLYSLGAITSMGKTTLMLQIADQIASQGIPVFYYSLEMSKEELIAKSLSRYSWIADPIAEKPPLGVNKILHSSRDQLTNVKKRKLDDAMEQLADAIEKYKAEGVPDNIRFFEGIGNIGVSEIRDDATLFHKLTGTAPAIFIDYLQILAPEEQDKRSTDKQITDKNVLELKRLARDLDTPIFVISSLNRSSYAEAISLQSFKESGAIEYGSDVLLGLQPANMITYADSAPEKKYNAGIIKDCKNELKERHLVVNVLKNRNGRTGTKALFNNNPIANYFSDKGIRWTDEEPLDVKEILKKRGEDDDEKFKNAISKANASGSVTVRMIASLCGWDEKKTKHYVMKHGYEIDSKKGTLTKVERTKL